MVMSPTFSDKAKRDFRLITKAKNGDQKAYAELLGYYKDSLYFLLIKMVHNKEDAEDLTIEAFEKAFRNLETYSPSFAFSTWLFKIATNNGIDFIRKKQAKKSRHIQIDDSDFGNDSLPFQKIHVAEKNLNPEENIIKEQKNNIVKLIIQKLPIDYRKIIIMRYFEEFSYIEIAEKLEIPIGTVKARLFRSRELLLSILKKHDINHSNF